MWKVWYDSVPVGKPLAEERLDAFDEAVEQRGEADQGRGPPRVETVSGMTGIHGLQVWKMKLGI
jgi:hypothetical protein